MRPAGGPPGLPGPQAAPSFSITASATWLVPTAVGTSGVADAVIEKLEG